MASSEEGDERGEVHVASSEAAREAASDGGASLAAARSGRRRRCATFRAATPDGSARSRAPPDDAAASGSSSSADSDPLMRLDFSRYARWSSPRRSAAASPRGAFVCRGAPRPRGVRDEGRPRASSSATFDAPRRAAFAPARFAAADARCALPRASGSALSRSAVRFFDGRGARASPFVRPRPIPAAASVQLGRRRSDDRPPPPAHRTASGTRRATAADPRGFARRVVGASARGGDARRGGEGGRHPSAPNVRGEK